jgi:hypothetical protein
MSNTTALDSHQDPASYEVQVVSTCKELEQLAPELLAPAAPADFFSTWPWFELLATHGTESQTPLLLVLIRDRRDHGTAHVLPLQRLASGRGAAYGAALSSLSNYYSSLYGPLGTTAQLTVGALRAALRYLRLQGTGSGVLNLHPLDTESFMSG